MHDRPSPWRPIVHRPSVGGTRGGSHPVGPGVNRRPLPLLLAPLVVLAGCATGSGSAHRERLTVPPAGMQTVSFHGVALDVPSAWHVGPPPVCDFTLPSGDDVVVSFDSGAASCPAFSPAGPTPAPRPAGTTTVVLAADGSDAPGPVAAPDSVTVVRHLAGVTVTVQAPSARAAEVATATLRTSAVDDVGCADRIDPSVAPTNPPSDRLLPTAPSDVVVCEYGQTDPTTTDVDRTPYWLVGSRRLTPGELTRFVAQCTTAVAATADGTAPFGPALRYLVTGSDGTTRVLASTTNLTPQPVSDGRHQLQTTGDGTYPDLPAVY